jgi:hypothetical protein
MRWQHVSGGHNDRCQLGLRHHQLYTCDMVRESHPGLLGPSTVTLDLVMTLASSERRRTNASRPCRVTW